MKLKYINITNILIALILLFFLLLNNYSCSEQNLKVRDASNDLTLNSDSARANENILKINYTEAGTVDDYSVISGDWYTQLAVGKPTSTDPRHCIIWLKFYLKSLPDNTDIISAKIFLFLISEYDSNDPPIFIHYSSDDSWTASSITGTSYPSYAQDYTDRNFGPFASGKWYSWNVTIDVKKELNDNKILSEMITNHENVGWKAFNKKEDYPANEPYLEIKYKAVSNTGFELTNGHGNGTEIYAGLQSYNFNTKIVSFNSPDDLDSVTMHLDPNGRDIQIKWDRVNNKFSELNDINDYISIDKFSGQYLYSIWDLNVSFIFNLNYPEEKLSDVKIEAYAGTTLLDVDDYKNIFIVQKNLIFTGYLTVSGEYQGILSENDWVREGELLGFSNLKVVYEQNTGLSPKSGCCQVKLTDDLSNIDIENTGSSGAVSLSISAEKTGSIANNYHISILPDSADKSAQPPFLLRIDSDIPGKPGSFELRADSQSDPSSTSDNDDSIYLSWSSADEKCSGIKGYYYGESGTTPIFTTDTNGQVSGLSEGEHFFEIYAEDNVGNFGGISSASIIIDMTDPVFSIFSPDENIWINETPVESTITITDTNGAGINTNSIEYSILRSGSDEWSSWQRPDNIIDDDITNITAKKELNLPEGNENHIKWRVTDSAGNGPVESKQIRIKVDTQPVLFSDFSPYSSTSQDITVNITLKDTSEVNEIEYRLLLTGEQEYNEWQKVTIPDFDSE